MTIKQDQDPSSGETSSWSPADDFIDRSSWPILRIRYPEKVTKESLDVHFAAMAAIAARHEKFVAIVCLNAIGSMTRELRQHVSAHLNHRDHDEAAKYLAGIAHVSNNWLSRASLTIVLSLSPPPYPNRTFRRLRDAEAWVRTLLPSHILPVTG